MKVLVAGDYSPRERISSIFDSDDYNVYFPELTKFTNSVDFSIVNFETCIADTTDQPIKKIGIHLKTDSRSLNLLSQLGFNMITLANNHIMDYGSRAMLKTLHAAEEKGIYYVGAGSNKQNSERFKIVTTNDRKLAVINACEHEFSIAEDNKAGCNGIDQISLFYQISEAKKMADYVLLILHGGHEHYQLPSPRMKRLFHFLIDCGADAVINHHQHCFSGFEYYKGKPIVYGLGNFCFDSVLDNKYRHDTFNYGYFAIINFDKEIQLEIYPYEQCFNKVGTYILSDRSSFDKKINQLNSIIIDDVKLANEFKSMAKSRENLSFLQPFSSHIMQGLYFKGLLPNMFKASKIESLLAMINCESHRDVLIENLRRRL